MAEQILFARGLAREGSHASAPRAIDLARQDAVTCGLTDAIGALRTRVDESPYDFALVVADGSEPATSRV